MCVFREDHGEQRQPSSWAYAIMDSESAEYFVWDERLTLCCQRAVASFGSHYYLGLEELMYVCVS